MTRLSDENFRHHHLRFRQVSRYHQRSVHVCYLRWNLRDSLTILCDSLAVPEVAAYRAVRRTRLQSKDHSLFIIARQEAVTLEKYRFLPTSLDLNLPSYYELRNLLLVAVKEEVRHPFPTMVYSCYSSHRNDSLSSRH